MTTRTEILTDRLLLRSPLESDAECVFPRYGHDPQVCRYLSWKPHSHVDETAAFVRKAIADEAAGLSVMRLIFGRDSGTLLGSISGQIQGHRIQFGYCLARDAWGYGYATEAASAFVAAALAKPGIWRVQAFCDVENRASARVLEKIGLTFEGTLRRYLVMPNLSDVPRDMRCYAKVPA